MLERGSKRFPAVVTSLWLLARPRAAREWMQQGCRSPPPPRPLSLCPPRLCQPGALWFRLWPASARYPLWGAVQAVAGTPRARRYGRWTDDRGWASGRWGPPVRTIPAAHLVILMQAVGCCVSCLSHPVNVLPVVSTWRRSARSTRRQRRSAHHQTSPKAALRSGFFRHSLWTRRGSCKKAQCGSTPGGALEARSTSPALWALSPSVGTWVSRTPPPSSCTLRALTSARSWRRACRPYRHALTTRGCFGLGRPGPYWGCSSPRTTTR
jgi:hypothetical protein